MMLAPLALVLALSTGQGIAEEIELPACGLPVPITPALLADLPDERLTGAGDATSAVLVGNLSGQMHGSVVFLRNRGVWRAFAAAPGASAVGVYRSAKGAVFVWTMPNVEGPGQQFDGLSMSSTGAARFCTRVPFPTTLNQPQWQSEFLELAAFNVDAKGRGVLIGSADVERAVKRKGRRKPIRQRVTLVYRYTSADGGRRWSTPAPATLAPMPGRYERLSGAPPALIAGLRAHAR